MSVHIENTVFLSSNRTETEFRKLTISAVFSVLFDQLFWSALIELLANDRRCIDFQVVQLWNFEKGLALPLTSRSTLAA